MSSNVLQALDPRADATTLAANFAAHGVVRVRGLLDEEALASVDAAVATHLRDVVPGLTRDVHFEADGSTVRVVNELQRYSPYLARLIEDPQIVETVEKIVGWQPQPFYAEYFAKRPHGSVANPHQDTAFETVVPHQYVHVWIALDDISPEMGPLRLWLGSHLVGVLPHEVRDFGGFQYIDRPVLDRLECPVAEGVARRGDAFILDTGIIHASGPNTSTRARPSLALAYRGVDTVHHG